MAILSFKCTESQRLFTSGTTRGFVGIQRVTERKLAQLDAAATLEFLRSPPGNEDYLKPMGMSANALARHLHVPASRVNDIVLERRGVSADTALRLGRFFGGDAQSWLNLQTAYDLRTAERDKATRAAVMAVEPLATRAA